MIDGQLSLLLLSLIAWDLVPPVGLWKFGLGLVGMGPLQLG